LEKDVLVRKEEMGKGKLWKKGKRKGCRKRGEAGKGRS
jgi:hypothetical protein